VDELPDPELDPGLVERLQASAALSEALNDMIEAIAGDPEAERAFDRLTACLNAWLACSAIARD
jgi:hypothetical protein